MKPFTIILAIIAILFFAAGFQSYENATPTQSFSLSRTSFTKSRIYLPALDENENSYLIPLDVEIKPGKGQILVNIDNPSFIIDTQASIRAAVDAAKKITKTDLKEIDVIFSINVGHAVISGPSAGAGMAIALTSILEQRNIKPGVSITAQVSSNGNIGPVGGIHEKIMAAEQAGLTTFLIPKGLATYEEPIQRCEENTTTNYTERTCTVTYEHKDIREETNLNIKEVSTLKQVIDIMLQ